MTRRTILSLFSGTELDGRFVAPDAIRPIAVFGGAEIDLREATLPYRVEIRCLAVFGGVEIIVPPDVNVDVSGHGIFGGFARPRNRPPLQPDRPTIVVSGFALFGGVTVKVKPRRGPPREVMDSDSDVKRLPGRRRC